MNKPKQGNVLWRLKKWRGVIIFLLFLCLVWFIWSFNIKPFKINIQINIAKYLVKKGKCEQAFVRMDNILTEKSFLDAYLRLKYADFLRECQPEMPEKSLEFVKKGHEILKENIEIQPYYTWNWILLGAFTNGLIEKEKNAEARQELIKEVNYYFERAYQLSPGRQEVFVEWTKADIISEEYQKAKEKSQKCIDLNPNYGECYWLMTLTQGYLGNFEELNSFAALAKEKGYNIESEGPLLELINMYLRIKNYQGLAETYPKLISVTFDKTKKAQLYASLAVVYKELGDKEKAREIALKVLELDPKAKPVVDEFLKSLEQ